MRYIYLGDRLTDPRFKNQPGDPVLDARGKCIIGRRIRNQLVIFASGEKVVVLARRLRLAEKFPN